MLMTRIVMSRVVRAECCDFYIIILSVIVLSVVMLNIIAPKYLLPWRHNDNQDNDIQHNDTPHNNKKGHSGKWHSITTLDTVMLSSLYAHCHLCWVSSWWMKYAECGGVGIVRFKFTPFRFSAMFRSCTLPVSVSMFKLEMDLISGAEWL
jgi:hypothetical protein